MIDESDMILQSIRDPGLPTHTFFYASLSTNKIVSPYFDSPDEAKEWLKQQQSK